MNQKCVEMSENELLNKVGVLMRDYRVVAPTCVDGVKLYAEITDAGRIALDDELPYKSPKEVILPQNETLFKLGKNGVEIDEKTCRQTLLFAAAPCDLKAIKVLDEVFIGKKIKYQDIYYKANREKLIIVGKACADKKSGCFCDERGISRDFSIDCDAFLQKTDGGWKMSFVTEKCSALFCGKNCGQTGQSEPPKETLKLTADENTLFDAINWDEITVGCQSCGVCTFICPTCHCFELNDTEEWGEMTRTRTWDSCMFPRFTLHASGHNPRAGKSERFRQRVLHKYVYIRDNIGITACTGCGRCIRECPGGVSIKKAVQALKQSEEGKRA